MYSASGKPICRPIHTGVFHAPEYLSLSETGHSRLVMLFLLIHPHGGTFHLPGLYQTGPDSMREALQMPRKSFLLAFGELHESGIIESDDRYRIIWMPCALRLVGPPVNPNVVKGYCRSLNQLPPSPLVQAAIPAYWESLKPYGPQFLEPFEKAFERVLEGFGKAEANPSESPMACDPNSYKSKNLYPHTDTEPLMAEVTALNNQVLTYLHHYGHSEGWPEASLHKIPSLAKANPAISLADLKASAHILQKNKMAKDPASYLFGIARNRKPLEDGCQRGDRTENGEVDASFSAFVDGQKVSFND